VDEFRLSSGDLWDIVVALRFLRRAGGDELSAWLPKGRARSVEVEDFLEGRSHEYLDDGDAYDLFLLVKAGKEQ
jgi:hypothetical protein